MYRRFNLPDDLTESVSVPGPQAPAPADNSTRDGTGHPELTEHPQHRPADVKGPQPFQKMETPLVIFI